MYAILPFVAQESTKSYKISDMITIPEGTSIYIPTLYLHRDPDIYENPLEFRPGRFFGSSNGKGSSKGVFRHESPGFINSLSKIIASKGRIFVCQVI
jgi:cytochrome P450